MYKKLFTPFVLGSLTVLLALCTISCAVDPVTGQPQLMLLSESDEINLGRQTDQGVVQEYGVYHDQELEEYLNAFLQELAQVSHRPNLPYQLKIVDSQVVNAFAVPGGYVYFTRGILAHLNSEAELIGVMGHELGHITARHSAEQYSRAQLAQIGLGLGMSLSDSLRPLAGLAEFGVGMLFLKFSRDNERESDDLGVEYATKLGYDASQLASFFDTLERMQESSGQGALPSWFSTHPNPVERSRTVERKAKEWQQQLGVKDAKVDRGEYLKRIDGLVFGEDPRQGLVDNNVFYHPDLRFQFPVPANWTLVNTRVFVQMLSPKEDAAIFFTISNSRSTHEAAQEFAVKSKATVIEYGRTRVSGLPAHRMVWQIDSQQGFLQAISYFIQKDARVYLFHGFSSVGRFRSYRPTFESVMMRFDELRNPKMLNAKPSRIRIRATPKAMSMRQALRALGAQEDELEELARLNGKGLDDPVPGNTLLKIVEKGR
ncbi:MAG: M48 family metalloprotease [Deltaproteobacteria bacterium]|nr:MAG: M48 family metalloprotease [Deltaproteobacteria bacterium]